MKRFTVEEANAALAEVVPMLERLRDSQQVMERRQDQVIDSVPGNGGGEAGREYLESSAEAGRIIADLNERGIVVRDPETGLIDFPAERDGREVFLCFRLGEDAVAWWHPPETGIAGRQPL